ncbi:54S ribosomal protein L25, mitochondrial [Friedmanniomyces endolithicus]|nr:54S ribosomal protein L25, mitochondrial [Friedmanniomyces endolithicus]KAK0813968.1 54S ribosomal protein L25, mitochondrial [Friedmanniomyces endolithicus]KAK0861138.1 54S ribosomal protein L25, mitochondrial [Friedmanniomyces endolithicus]KAK0879896.1 54S ribosomal protein L25, mitochondrial [Friedmanniomyces endolithicus]KAK0907630.1 54S ribosomal protein L25, mitochondrial [Friedmanniomyces endolithicus]
MAAVAATSQHVSLAQSLPPRLLQLFKRFPPAQLSASQSVNTTADAPSEDPLITTTTWKKNPFLPFKNPRTQAWHGPHYSLRRQADLFKLAQEHNVMPLMPICPKHPDVKTQSRIQHGLRVKGTGEGQRVKGKHWERTLQQRLATRRLAMERMPDMVALWKERGHGKGWKKYPRSKGKVGTGKDDVFRSDMRHTWVNERPVTRILVKPPSTSVQQQRLL